MTLVAAGCHVNHRAIVPDDQHIRLPTLSMNKGFLALMCIELAEYLIGFSIIHSLDANGIGGAHKQGGSARFFMRTANRVRVAGIGVFRVTDRH